MLNIPRSIADPHYRYQMPHPRCKLEGKGNKLRIMNLQNLSQALRVPETYILKFLGYELSCKIDENEPVLFTRIDDSKLLKHLDKFIEQYVLCNKCEYPEVKLKVEKEKLFKICKACGANSQIVDRSKLTPFIIKNHSKFEVPYDDELMLHDDNFVIPGGISVKIVPQEKNEEQKEEEEEEKKEEDNSFEHDFNEDCVIDKVKECYKQFSKDLTIFIEKSAETDRIISLVDEEVPERYKNKRTHILFNAIFDVNFAINKNKGLLIRSFKEFNVSDPEIDLLLNLESFLLIKNKGETLEGYVPTLLKHFWDEELLSDEFIIDWDEGKLFSKLMADPRYYKQVDDKFKLAAKPFIEWIKKEEDAEDVEGESTQ